MNRTDRLLAVVLELQGRGWTTAALAQQCGVSERTVYRDVLALNGAMLRAVVPDWTPPTGTGQIGVAVQAPVPAGLETAMARLRADGYVVPEANRPVGPALRDRHQHRR